MKVVIVGAGIAGVAVARALALLGVKVTIVERGSPLSLTSDKSTECYRNFWPGANDGMVPLMNRSIQLLRGLAAGAGDRLRLNRRGYLYATFTERGVDRFESSAKSAEEAGAGELRFHGGSAKSYAAGNAPDGTDLLVSDELIRENFPWLDQRVMGVLHVRNAGWFSGQQLGQILLEEARSNGAELVIGEVTSVSSRHGGHEVEIQTDRGVVRVTCDAVVNAAGPYQREVAAMMEFPDIPISAERHLKVSVVDHLGAVPRGAPLTILADPITLPWDGDERRMLAGESDLAHLLGELPGGVHCRPDGAGNSLLILWNTHLKPVEPTFPIPEDPQYAELALRAMSVLVPKLREYGGNVPDPYVDGGYYMKTRSNRPIISSLGKEGTWILGGLSGFGMMAALGAAELLSELILGKRPTIGVVSNFFSIDRYVGPYSIWVPEDEDDGQL